MDTTLTLFFNHMGQPWLDTTVLVLTKPLTWLPLYALLLLVLIQKQHAAFHEKKKALTSLLFILLGAALCILVADQVSSHLCKPLFHRLRPTHEPALEGIVRIVRGYRGGPYGFFSSHAANTCALAVFLGRLIRKRWVTILLVLYVAVNSWTRLYLGVHYVTDILAGLLFGALVGYCASCLCEKHIYEK